MPPTGIKFRYDASLSNEELATRVESLERNKRPRQTLPYIGIEIEFFSDYSKQAIYNITAKYNLQRICRFKTDGSIRVNRDGQTPLELVALMPQKYWKRYLRAIVSCLKRCKAEVNDSCGLHVHLDHRVCTGRNPSSTYLSLQRMQNFLFSLASPNRRNNRFCPFEPQTDFYEKMMSSNRYSAINLTALRKYRTIEMRLYHGTLDMAELMTYINCVLFAVKKSDDAVHHFNESSSFEWQLPTLLADKGMPDTAKAELRKRFPSAS